MSVEALQIVEKSREVKGKGEKERYTHLTAEFQRIARRDKKVFLSDQCKEIEENNRMEFICRMPGWVKHKLESRLPGEISITSDKQMIPPLWQK